MSDGTDVPPGAVVVRAVLVGCGTSSGIPRIQCLVRPDEKGKWCELCRKAHDEGLSSKNNRLNPALLLTIRTSKGKEKQLLVDCGKTFRQSAIKVLLPLGVHALHGVLITHEHADAGIGIDDLREFSSSKQPLPVYCDGKTMDWLGAVFPYLFVEAKTFVAAIDWKKFAVPEGEASTTISVIEDDFNVRVVPVVHGREHRNTCNSFVFPLEDGGYFAYVSDIVELTEPALAALVELQPLKLLVIDLLMAKSNYAHFSRTEAIEAAKRINAERTIFTGMGCELDYPVADRELRAENPTHAPGFDGMVLYRDRVVLPDEAE